MMEGLVILAGGISSRMKNSPAGAVAQAELLRQADARAKGMIGVGAEGRPLLDYQLYNARAAGIREVVIVVAEGDRDTRSRYGTKDAGNDFHGLSISYAIQRIPPGRAKPLGTADALLVALRSKPDWEGRYFIVCNSDNLYSRRALELLLALEAQGGLIDYDIDGLRFPPERIGQFGLTRKNREGYLTGITEKPGADLIEKMRAEEGRLFVSMNIWRLSRDLVLPYLESCPLHPLRGEKELPAALDAMVREHPRALKAIPLKEHVPDLTYKADIEVVQEYLLNQYGGMTWEE